MPPLHPFTTPLPCPSVPSTNTLQPPRQPPTPLPPPPSTPPGLPPLAPPFPPVAFEASVAVELSATAITGKDALSIAAALRAATTGSARDRVELERRSTLSMVLSSGIDLTSQMTNVRSRVCGGKPVGCTVLLQREIATTSRQLHHARLVEAGDDDGSPSAVRRLSSARITLTVVLPVAANASSLVTDASSTEALTQSLVRSVEDAIGQNVTVMTPMLTTMLAVITLIMNGTVDDASVAAATSLSSTAVATSLAGLLGVNASTLSVVEASIVFPPRPPPNWPPLPPPLPVEPPSPPSPPSPSALLPLAPPLWLTAATTDELRTALLLDSGGVSGVGVSLLTVRLTAAVYMLDGMELVVRHPNCRIEGPSPDGAILDAGGLSRHLQVHGSMQLELVRLHLRDGLALANDSDVWPHPSPASGGAVLLRDHASLALRNSTITGCRTASDTGGWAWDANEAAWEYAAGLNGGAICAMDGSRVFLSDSQIESSWAGATGGAIHVTGYSTVELAASSLRNCSANGGGGGVSATNYAQLEMTGDSRIESCNAMALASMPTIFSDGREAARGGAVLLQTYSDAHIDGGTIVGCQAEAGGGLAATRFCTATLHNVLLHSCSARNRSMTSDPVRDGDPLGLGGGIHACCKSSLNLTAVTILNASADGHGGALSVAASVHLSRSTLIGSRAALHGAALHLGRVSDAVPPIANLEAVNISEDTAPAGTAVYLGRDRLMQATMLSIEYGCGGAAFEVAEAETAASLRPLPIRQLDVRSTCESGAAPGAASMSAALNRSVPTCADETYIDLITSRLTPLCAPGASCADRSAAGLTSVVCSCMSGAYTLPTATFAPLAPYRATEGCVTPVQGESLLHSQPKVLAVLSKGQSSPEVRSLDVLLTLRGNDWTAAASLVNGSFTWRAHANRSDSRDSQAAAWSWLTLPVGSGTLAAGALSLSIPLVLRATGLRDRSEVDTAVHVELSFDASRQQSLTIPVSVAVRAEPVASRCTLHSEPPDSSGDNWRVVTHPPTADVLVKTGVVGGLVSFYLAARDIEGVLHSVRAQHAITHACRLARCCREHAAAAVLRDWHAHHILGCL